VAWVAGTPVDVSEVDSREGAARLRRPGRALPGPDSTEGRQLRRWLVQVLAAERLVAIEAERLGIDPGNAPPLRVLAPDGPALLELGSVAASVLTDHPLARALFVVVTGHVTVPASRVARYYAANHSQFRVREQRIIRHAIVPSAGAVPNLADRPLRTLHRGELVGPVEDAAFAADPGSVVGPIHDPLGWHVLRVEAARPASLRPLAEVADQIQARLLAAARRRAFTGWLDGRYADLVRLAPGFEHPGDPSQPDNTHRH
jgi:[acyl-carrier-protein] S-malonyltransferase